MAQVIDRGYDLPTRLKGLMQHAGGGPGVVGWEAAQLQQSRYAIEIARAAQQLQQEQQAFQLSVADRARKIQNEEADRKTQEGFNALKLYQGMLGVQQDQKARADEQALSAAPSPFDVIATNPNLPEHVAPIVQQAQQVSRRVGPKGADYLAERLLPEITKAIDEHQREQFKSGMADRMSRLSYGEDESIAEGLKQLGETADLKKPDGTYAVPIQQLVAQEFELRKNISDANKKNAKKQRELAYATQLASTLTPGPAADQADAALHDLQAEIIDGPTAIQRIHEAQFGLSAPKPAKRPEELYLESAGIAQRALGGITHTPDEVLTLTERIYKEALSRQGQQGVPGNAKERSPGSSSPGGLPFQQAPQNGDIPREASSNNGPAPQAVAPASPAQTVKAVEQAKELTGGEEKKFQAWYAERAKRLGLDPNPDAPEHFYDYRAAFEAGAEPDASGHWPSQFKKPGHPREIIDGVNTRTGQPVDRAGAIKAAEEAAKNGASDEELRALLKAAGIDADAPASTLDEAKPKKKRRQAERVGPNF